MNDSETIASISASPQLIVLDTSTPSLFSDIKFAEKLRLKFPNVVLVLMGTHVTALPEETLSLSEGIVDAVLLGEGEIALTNLGVKIKADVAGGYDSQAKRSKLFVNLKGFAYRKSAHEIMVNDREAQIKNLDHLPFLAGFYKRHLQIKDYFFAAGLYPEIQIMTSRGCVARCSFCVYPHTMHALKYRMRSPESIIEEVEWVVENLPDVKQIGFEDDTFSGSKKRTVAFCELMIERGLNKRITWYCNERTTLDFDTLKLMKSAGCEMLTVGYRSATEEILLNIDKKRSVSDTVAFSRNCHKAGIRVHGCFMVGNYGETKESMQESLNLALQLSDDTMQFFPLIVYPGTPDWLRFRQDNLLEIKDYSSYLNEAGGHRCTVKTRDMSPDDLTEWCNKARRAYYLRVGYVVREISSGSHGPSRPISDTQITEAFLEISFAFTTCLI